VNFPGGISVRERIVKVEDADGPPFAVLQEGDVPEWFGPLPCSKMSITPSSESLPG